jgi:hypothetical protein
MYKYNIFEIMPDNKRKLLYEKCSSNIEELVYSSAAIGDNYDSVIYVNDSKKIGKIIGIINATTIKVLLENEEKDFSLKEKKSNKKNIEEINEIKTLTFQALK